MTKPRVFLGSSTKSKALAETLQVMLEPEAAECQIWDQGVFELSKGFLESLTAKLDTFDFAVLVLAPDDLLIIQEEEKSVARDNIVFELGLFIGNVGLERTLFVVPEDVQNARLPSDILGVPAAGYRFDLFQKSGQAALVRPAIFIKEKFRSLGPKESNLLEKMSFGIPSFQDIESFYHKTGLTYAYLARNEAIDHMINDIKVAKNSIAMYSRVYISTLIKDANRFTEAIGAAAIHGNLDKTELLVTHASTDPRDEDSVNKIWQLEDPDYEEWPTAEDYKRHLKRSDVLFKKRHKELCERLAPIPPNSRRRVRFQRAYLSNCILPYSLVVIDESIVYVSFYSLSRERIGTYAPTMRLICGKESPHPCWARLFLDEMRVININHTIPGPPLSLI